jgi:hypothetical protein
MRTMLPTCQVPCSTTERGMHVFEKMLEKKQSGIREELEVFGESAKSWKFSEHPRKALSFPKIHDRRKVIKKYAKRANFKIGALF